MLLPSATMYTPATLSVMPLVLILVFQPATPSPLPSSALSVRMLLQTWMRSLI